MDFFGSIDEYYEVAVRMLTYIPYVFCAFVILTLVPDSWHRICEFADANYEANRYKYHRCYAPDVCCHNLHGASSSPVKTKTRKVVRRVYAKKPDLNTTVASATANANAAVEESENFQKPPVQTNINVNKIAQMFESAGNQKKINRVMPTVLPPEMRKSSRPSIGANHFCNDHFPQKLFANQNETPANVLKQQQYDKSCSINSSDHHAADHQSAKARSDYDDRTTMPLSRRCSTTTPTSASSLDSPVRPSSPIQQPKPIQLNMKSSVEDLYAAIARSADESPIGNRLLCNDAANGIAPVTSIDDILSQRRLSRPLSAYSISDLLNEDHHISDMDASCLKQFLHVLNKA